MALYTPLCKDMDWPPWLRRMASEPHVRILYLPTAQGVPAQCYLLLRELNCSWERLVLILQLFSNHLWENGIVTCPGSSAPAQAEGKHPKEGLLSASFAAIYPVALPSLQQVLHKDCWRAA